MKTLSTIWLNQLNLHAPITESHIIEPDFDALTDNGTADYQEFYNQLQEEPAY